MRNLRIYDFVNLHPVTISATLWDIFSGCMLILGTVTHWLFFEVIHRYVTLSSRQARNDFRHNLRGKF
jgi:hypothetical protein